MKKILLRIFLLCSLLLPFAGCSQSPEMQGGSEAGNPPPQRVGGTEAGNPPLGEQVGQESPASPTSPPSPPSIDPREGTTCTPEEQEADPDHCPPAVHKSQTINNLGHISQPDGTEDTNNANGMTLTDKALSPAIINALEGMNHGGTDGQLKLKKLPKQPLIK